MSRQVIRIAKKGTQVFWRLSNAAKTTDYEKNISVTTFDFCIGLLLPDPNHPIHLSVEKGLEHFQHILNVLK